MSGSLFGASFSFLTLATAAAGACAGDMSIGWDESTDAAAEAPAGLLSTCDGSGGQSNPKVHSHVEVETLHSMRVAAAALAVPLCPAALRFSVCGRLTMWLAVEPPVGDSARTAADGAEEDAAATAAAAVAAAATFSLPMRSLARL